jgi:acyl-CoA thioester hydrolase
LVYPDTVTVGTRVTDMGRASMRLGHAVYSHSQRALVADGETVVVFFDFQAQRPKRIPAEVRQKLEAFQGPLPMSLPPVSVSGV